MDIVRPCGDGWEVLNSAAAKEMRAQWEREGPDNRLFDACFRIQKQAMAAVCSCACWRCKPNDFPPGDHCVRCNCWYNTGHYPRYIPLIVENVRGAIPWVGRSAWNYGSFHLWGDVPALMPINMKRAMKCNPDGTARPQGSWFAKADGGLLVGMGSKGRSGGGWFGDGKNGTTRKSDPRDVRKQADGSWMTPDGTKIGGDWFCDPNSTCRKHGSRSSARKLASAEIAKIPLPLAQHIALVYKPRTPISPAHDRVRSLANEEARR